MWSHCVIKLSEEQLHLLIRICLFKNFPYSHTYTIRNYMKLSHQKTTHLMPCWTFLLWEPLVLTNAQETVFHSLLDKSNLFQLLCSIQSQQLHRISISTCTAIQPFTSRRSLPLATSKFPWKKAENNWNRKILVARSLCRIPSACRWDIPLAVSCTHYLVEKWKEYLGKSNSKNECHL